MHQLHPHNHYLMTQVICTTFNILYSICFPLLIPVGVLSKHQRVNLCYCASGPDGMLKRHKVYTGSDRMSQCLVHGCARVISTEKFIVGVTNRRERDGSQVSDGKVEGVLRA